MIEADLYIYNNKIDSRIEFGLVTNNPWVWFYTGKRLDDRTSERLYPFALTSGQCFRVSEDDAEKVALTLTRLMLTPFSKTQTCED